MVADVSACHSRFRGAELHESLDANSGSLARARIDLESQTAVRRQLRTGR